MSVKFKPTTGLNLKHKKEMDDNKLKILLHQIRSVFSDYGEDFDVKINMYEDKQVDGIMKYYEISIFNKHMMEKPIGLFCRYDLDGYFQMEFSGGNWKTLNKCNVFAYLFFKSINKREV